MPTATPKVKVIRLPFLISSVKIRGLILINRNLKVHDQIKEVMRLCRKA